MRTLFYIHGFASSGRSSKAVFLTARCAERRVVLRSPDFNEPDFATLTASRMLEQLAGHVSAEPPGPVALVGSSLGGFVAWHAAALQRAPGDPPHPPTAAAARWRALAETHPVDRLVLLAPALDFPNGWRTRLTPAEFDAWRTNGVLTVFHYGENAERAVHFSLYEDGLLYSSAQSAPSAPTVIIQGRRDDVVDPAMVERMASGKPNVTQWLVDDDHQLHASIELIWRETAAFVGIDG